MSRVTIGIIACSETPAQRAIALVVVGVREAVRGVDGHVPLVELPIVSVLVLEASRIESTERVMRKEQRPAERHAERQLDVVVTLAIEERAAGCKPAMIDDRVNGVPGS